MNLLNLSAFSRCESLFRAGLFLALFLFFGSGPLLAKDLSEKEIEAKLVQLQKPGNYSSKRDNPVLRKIFETSAVNQYPELVAGALQAVLSVSPRSYDNLMKEYPDLHEIRVSNTAVNPFRTAREEKVVTRAAIDYLNRQMLKLLPDSDPLRGTFLKDWTNLRPLSRLLHQIPEDERVGHSDTIMESIVFKSKEREFKGSFASVLFTVIQPSIDEIFGDPLEKITHLEMVRSGKEIIPVIHATHKIDGQAEVKNPYGFYSVTLPAIRADGDLPKKPLKYTWSVDGRPMESKVTLKNVGDDIISQEPAPPYERIAPEGSPNFLVVFGTNLADESAESIKNYRSLLKQNGFEPDGDEVELPSLKKWLRHQVISGETGVVVKEAHAHGDLSNLVEIDRLGKLITYRREMPDGPPQVFRIVYPYDGKSPTNRVTNRDLGAWVRKRLAMTDKPIILCNTSCWSVDQAENQVPEVASKDFIEVASYTMVDVIQKDPKNGTRILLNGLLAKKSYKEIREALKQNEGYRRVAWDHFWFPDEKRYHKNMYQKTDGAIRVRVATKDRITGRNYEGQDLFEKCWSLMWQVGRRWGK